MKSASELPLHAVLTAHSAEIIHRWRARVEGELVPASLSTVELVDHLPLFLEEIIAMLRGDAAPPDAAEGTDETSSAADHGEQRLRLGFSLNSVVREYGELREAIVETAHAAGATVSPGELRVIFNAIVAGIANAVSEYSRQRDAELQRQHNEHFAFVAHELRNPLTSARTSLELLKRKKLLDASLRETLALERSLAGMQQLIDHTLDVARTSSGVELRRQQADLKELLTEAGLAAASEADDKGIELRILAPAAMKIEVDVRLLRSALGNLVRNAVKYSKASGVIEVRARLEGAHLSIEVEDCCGGLAPGNVEKAFAPFVRLKSSEQGFGLGLAIAKQAVDAHGGSIRIQNLPGKGCIFVLEIPLAE